MTMDRAKASEQEYFAQLEAERQRDQAWEMQRDAAETARREREHVMALQVRRCPKCSIVLEVSALRGVEIDRCRSCNGVWLDDGELERLMRPELGLLQRFWHAFRSNKRPAELPRSVDEPSAGKPL